MIDLLAKLPKDESYIGDSFNNFKVIRLANLRPYKTEGSGHRYIKQRTKTEQAKVMGQLTAVKKALEKRGLIEHVFEPQRKHVYKLTPEGVAALKAWQEANL